MRRARLTVHVSTKLNRSHAVTGAPRPDPAHARPHRQRRPGERRAVRDRRGLHGHGPRLPRQPRPREPAPALRAGHRLPAWPARVLGADSRTPRGRSSSRTTPRSATASPASSPASRTSTPASRHPGGFALPHAPRDERRFPTATGKANFTAAPVEYPELPAGRLLLQTLRSHDQYNTTIYGLDDRYRGIKDGRRVVLVNPDDARRPGPRRRLVHRPGQRVEGRRRAPRARLPRRPLPHRPRLRRRLLPRDQRAGPARLHRRHQQHPGQQVRRHPLRGAPERLRATSGDENRHPLSVCSAV